MAKKVTTLACKEGEIKIRCSYSDLLDPKGLIAHPDNNNTHSEKQKEIAKAVLLSTGWLDPVVVSRSTMRIISGHLRAEVAAEMGLAHIPCSLQDFSGRVDEVKCLTVMNELARHADFSTPKFKDFQGQVKEEIDNTEYQESFFNPHAWGFEKWPKEKAEKTKKEPVIVIKEGDVWLLGPHKLELGGFNTPNTADKVQKLIKSWRKLQGAPAILEATGQTFEEVLKERIQQLNEL